MSNQKADLKTSFDRCQKEAENALWATRGYDRQMADSLRASEDSFARVSRPAYFAIVKALSGLLGKTDAILDLYSGDSLVPVTLAHAGGLRKIFLNDVYSAGEMASVGKSLVRRMGLQSRAHFIDTPLSRNTKPDFFNNCPTTVSIVNTGLSLPTKLQKSPSTEGLIRQDDYVTPHYFPLAGKGFQVEDVLNFLATILRKQTDLVFADIVPPSKWTQAGDLETSARSEFGNLVASTPWTLEQLNQVPGRAIVVGRLKKAAQ